MKALFIGNSHTFYNDMPYLFAGLCAARGVNVQPTMLTRGGECLKNHAASEQVLFNIRYGEYDLCVVQEVESTFPSEEEYRQSLDKLLGYARAARLPVGLYENFAPEGDYQRQHYLSDIVQRAGSQLHLPVARAGSAFALCQREHPEIDLYFTDRRHASLAGSYLVALTMVRGLMGLPVDGLPGRIEHWGRPVIDLDAATAAALQRVAGQC